jgi:hypothetical protein
MKIKISDFVKSIFSLSPEVKASNNIENIGTIIATPDMVYQLSGQSWSDKMKLANSNKIVPTPTILEKLSSVPRDISSPVIFKTNYFGGFDISKIIFLKKKINYANTSATWTMNSILIIDNFDKSAVIAAIGSFDIKIIICYLKITSPGTFILEGTNYNIDEMKVYYTKKINTGRMPVCMFLAYTDNKTGITYMDFVETYFDPEGASPLSQLEYFYKQSPARIRTKSTLPGMWLQVYNSHDDPAVRFADVNVKLYFRNVPDYITGLTDKYGNLILEFTAAQYKIVKADPVIIKVVLEFDGTTNEITTNLLVSGNHFNNLGIFLLNYIPS